MYNLKSGCLFDVSDYRERLFWLCFSEIAFEFGTVVDMRKIGTNCKRFLQ